MTPQRYLLDNLDWLSDQLAEYNDDYIIIDCPGQIELYTHTPLLSKFIGVLQTSYNYHVCACYLLESNFVDDVNKYFAGTLSAMSSMINLEVPMINVLSKVDLLKRGETGSSRSVMARGGRTGKGLDRFLDPDPTLILSEANSRNPKFYNLNKAIVSLIEDFSLINFRPLDVTSEDSVGDLLSHIDNAMQYGEDEEPREPKDMDTGDFGGDE